MKTLDIEYCKQHEGWNHVKFGGTVSWFKTAESLMEGLKHSPKNYFKKLSQEQIESLINELYKLCCDSSKGYKYTWDTAPLVFNKYRVALRRKYTGLQGYIEKSYGIKLQLHDGFGPALANGKKFEEQVRVNIINFLNNIIESGTSKLIDIQYIYDLYNNGALNGIIEDLKKDKLIDLNDRVILTGGENTKRNRDKSIIDTTTFEIQQDISNVIKNSGEIIADITIISSKGNQYISIKKDYAQNTSINIRCVSDYLTKGINKEGYDNFCKTFGLDADQLESVLRNHKSVNLDFSNPNISDIEKLIKAVIGGNYWYLKSYKCVYVSELKGKLNKILNIRTTSKTIVIDGEFDGRKIQLKFRTSDGNKEFPYRFFVEFDMFDFFK